VDADRRGESGISEAIRQMPDEEHRILHRRVAEHQANMTATLAGHLGPRRDVVTLALGASYRHQAAPITFAGHGISLYRLRSYIPQY
jgi:hypothetical protein